MTSNEFLSSIARKFNSMSRYEDKKLHAKALDIIPMLLIEQKAQERMRILQKQIRQGAMEDINISIQEMLLLELLAWFKTFFEWVDNPDCDSCLSETQFSHISSDKKLLLESGADRIEMHRCKDSKCGHLTPFERHSDPERALEAREGRCGEWAVAFTLLCRAMGWQSRLILDSTDHAWTEVYSIAQKRWLHCDPCENICDTPLIYETGWGKKLSYIIAYSFDDIQDVTWRYSADHSAVLRHRNNCSEFDLMQTIVNLRELKQCQLSLARRDYLAKRTALELAELMNEKYGKATDADYHGRTSGSLSWRLQRGETKVTENKTWTATAVDLSAGFMTIRYSPTADQYEKISKDNKILETVEKWENGAFNIDRIFRKEERDWKMVYLCREETANEGKIQWKFSANGRKINKVNVYCDSKVYESGEVKLTLIGANKTIEFSSPTVETLDCKGSDSIILTACLSGGHGDCGWQHAQLFRRPLHSHDYPFSVTINFL